jgi:hypothetical protein
MTQITSTSFFNTRLHVHPHAIGDYDPWINPGPKRDFVVTLGFALQRANAKIVRDPSPDSD